jgi:pyruvate dehydrogenase E2 component (dihydrolipoamide acetyltransferase)
MGMTSIVSRRGKPRHLAAALAVLALVAASPAPVWAQAQIGGALPSLSVPPTLPAPISQPALTPLAPMTAPPLASAAPVPQTAAPAPAAARAQPAQR